MKTQLKHSKKLNKQSGANAVEYGLVMALVVAAMLGAAKALDTPITDMFKDAGEKMKNMVGG